MTLRPHLTVGLPFRAQNQIKDIIIIIKIPQKYKVFFLQFAEGFL
jgi:hypothetical protein